MKSVATLICIAAILVPYTSVAVGRASSLTANNLPSGNAIQDQATGPRHAQAKPTRQAHRDVSSLKGTVVSEMRDTKAFVKETVDKPGGSDRMLMLVAATGLIVLQLRRKHKSLPQRPIST
jgi:hypothetical protein